MIDSPAKCKDLGIEVVLPEVINGIRGGDMADDLVLMLAAKLFQIQILVYHENASTNPLPLPLHPLPNQVNLDFFF